MRIINATGKILYGRTIALANDKGFDGKFPQNPDIRAWKREAERAVKFLNEMCGIKTTLLKNALDVNL